MIFSNSTSEIYWILSTLLKNFDIYLLKQIINEKKRLEDNEINDWYIKQGLLLNKLKINDHKELYIKKILFNHSKESYHIINNYHVRIFHYKILFEKRLMTILHIVNVILQMKLSRLLTHDRNQDEFLHHSFRH